MSKATSRIERVDPQIVEDVALQRGVLAGISQISEMMSATVSRRLLAGRGLLLREEFSLLTEAQARTDGA
jgi:hypothetical protein